MASYWTPRHWQHLTDEQGDQDNRACHSSGHYWNYYPSALSLTDWGQLTHTCISKLTMIGSYNGLSPDRRQAIIWTNAGILLIWPLGTKFRQILRIILISSFKKIHLKMSSAKYQPFCHGLNVRSWPKLHHDYRKISNISRTKSQNLNVSRLSLQLSLCNILKPGVKWRMKM